MPALADKDARDRIRLAEGLLTAARRVVLRPFGLGKDDTIHEFQQEADGYVRQLQQSTRGEAVQAGS